MTNLLFNGDLQSLNWETLADSNQRPEGWNVSFTPNGQPMFWPVKGGWSNGNRVVFDAIAERQLEFVHKGFVKNSEGIFVWNLPPDEIGNAANTFMVGVTDDGKTPVRGPKAFHGPSCLTLWQDVSGLTPGRRLRLTAYVTIKSTDVPHGPDGKFEADHARLRVALGNVEEQRTYAEMLLRHDWPASSQLVQEIILENTVPADGKITVASNAQLNWSDDDKGGTLFFYGPFRLEYVDAPAPQPEPTPDPAPNPEPGEVGQLRTEVKQLRAEVSALSAERAQEKIRIAALEGKYSDWLALAKVQADLSIDWHTRGMDAAIKFRDDLESLP